MLKFALTSQAASRWTRPARTRYRGGRRLSCVRCEAVIPASWGCRSATPPVCYGVLASHRTGGPVTEEILINVTPQETRVAVVEHGVVQEVQVERSSARGLVGNICMGKVVRVLPGMQSAFIDIGGARAAFLHVADIWAHRQEGAEQKPIEKLLSEGQNLLVQVVKDPIGTKGARLSTQVSIAGRLLVYLPQESHIGISQRIADEEERLHLREKLQQLLPPTITGG